MLQQEARNYDNSADRPSIVTDDISELIRSINAKIESAILGEAKTSPDEKDEAEKNKANAAKISNKLTQCFDLLNQIKNLQPNYQEKAIDHIRGWLKNFYKFLIQRVIDEDYEGYLSGRDLNRLARWKLPDLGHFKVLQDKITSIKAKTSQFSEPVKQYFDAKLEEQEKNVLNSKDERDINYKIEFIDYTEQKIDYSLAHPGLAEYALTIAGKVPSLDFLKTIHNFRKYTERINEALSNASEWEDLLKKYDFFNANYKREFRFIKETKEIHLGQKKDEVTHIMLLNHNRDSNIHNVIKGMQKLKWFDEQIAPLLSSNRKRELAHLYVWDYKFNELDLTQNEFKKRVEGYLMVVNTFIESDTFNPEKRGEFAMNTRESLENFCIEEIVINGGNPEEIKKQIEDEFEKVNKSARVTINVHRGNLEKIYSDGELITYHELGAKHREKGLFGDTNYSSRREEKDRQLQYPEDRFIVGALSSENGYDEFIGAAPFYGHGVIELRWDKIKDRVFFLECDSMNRDDSNGVKNIMPEWLSKKWKNLDSRKLDYEGAKFVKALMEVYLKRHGLSHIHTMYVEAHVLQPVTTDDFSRITYAVLHSDDKKSDDKKRSDLRDLQEDINATQGDAPPFKIIEADLDLRVKDDPERPGGQEQGIKNDEGF